MNNITPKTETKLHCDGHRFKQLIASGLARLDSKHQQINTFNVFPVPDGDTGTNMLLTMRSAYREIAELEHSSVSAVATALSHGALMGARGNSGVILSQLWRGFARAMESIEAFDVVQLAAGLREASDTAYKGVIKPVEGTILTVSREMAKEAEAAAEETDDLILLFERVIRQAQAALDRTPEQLPVLKQAGVVDSGGAGLVAILEGIMMDIQGESLALPEPAVVQAETPRETGIAADDPAFEFPYDIQFIIHGEDLNVEDIRTTIDAMGDSTLVVGDEHTIKVHVHVKDPGQPISYGSSLGMIDDVVVENMLAQSLAFFGPQQTAHPPTGRLLEPVYEPKPGDVATVAVVSGEGMIKVYQSLGVTNLVSGGQSMNPSTEELLAAVSGLTTDRVVILPNNKNILLAAQQAAVMAKESGFDVRVVPTVTLPQGISALVAFQPESDLDTLVKAMNAAKDMVITAQVTTAVRSVAIDGIAVQEGQIIGLIDGTLVEAGDDLDQIVLNLLQQMRVDEQELITVYYGDGIDSAHAEQLADKLREVFTEQEIEVVHGGQPHYHYILSSE